MSKINLDKWVMSPDKEKFFNENIFNNIDIAEFLEFDKILKSMTSVDWNDLVNHVMSDNKPIVTNASAINLAKLLVSWAEHIPTDIDSRTFRNIFNSTESKYTRETISTLLNITIIHNRAPELIPWALNQSVLFVNDIEDFTNSINALMTSAVRNRISPILFNWIDTTSGLTSHRAFGLFIKDPTLLDILAKENIESSVIFKATKDIRFAPKAIQKMFLHKDEK